MEMNLECNWKSKCKLIYFFLWRIPWGEKKIFIDEREFSSSWDDGMSMSLDALDDATAYALVTPHNTEHITAHCLRYKQNHHDAGLLPTSPLIECPQIYKIVKVCNISAQSQIFQPHGRKKTLTHFIYSPMMEENHENSTKDPLVIVSEKLLPSLCRPLSYTLHMQEWWKTSTCMA